MHIQLIVMCYNSAELLEQVLDSYCQEVDSILIGIDSKTTDNTYKIAQYYGDVVEFNFKDFSQARNLLLDYGASLVNDCYQLFIDDSFELRGPKNAIRKSLESGAECYSILIDTCDRSYFSKRIIKSTSGIRYSGVIHEELGTTSKIIKRPVFHDIQCDSHRKRRLLRLPNDLLLFDDTFMGKYYKAMTMLSLVRSGVVSLEDTVKSFRAVLDCKMYNEFTYMCMVELFKLTEDKTYLGEAVICFPRRAFEAYYFLFEVTKDIEYLKLAYKWVDYPAIVSGKFKCPINPYIGEAINRDFVRLCG